MFEATAIFETAEPSEKRYCFKFCFKCGRNIRRAICLVILVNDEPWERRRQQQTETSIISLHCVKVEEAQTAIEDIKIHARVLNLELNMSHISSIYSIWYIHLPVSP